MSELRENQQESRRNSSSGDSSSKQVSSRFTDSMSIGQLAKLANVSNRTVRYYEELGLIVPQHRGSNRYRYYDESHVDRLRLIKMLQESGFALKEIVAALNPILDPKGNITYSGLEMSKKIFKSLKDHQARLRLKQNELETTLDVIALTMNELSGCFQCTNSHDIKNCANCSSGPAEIVNLGRRVAAVHFPKKAEE